MSCCSDGFARLLQNADDGIIQLNNAVEARSLTDVPVREWRIFTYAVNSHIVLASLLFVSGCVCFCLGLQFSLFFDAVNCGDGTNIFPPLLNLLAAFTGIFALRAQNLHWPPFIHVLSVVVAIPLNLITAIDLAVSSAHWNNYWDRFDPRVKPDLEDTTGWQVIDWWQVYLYMDIAISLVAFFNDIACAVVIYVYVKFWCRRPFFEQHRLNQ